MYLHAAVAGTSYIIFVYNVEKTVIDLNHVEYLGSLYDLIFACTVERHLSD